MAEAGWGQVSNGFLDRDKCTQKEVFGYSSLAAEHEDVGGYVVWAR